MSNSIYLAQRDSSRPQDLDSAHLDSTHMANSPNQSNKGQQPKKRLWKLLLLAFSVFLIGLVALFPARLAWQWFGEDARQQGVLINGLSGSIWNGQAQQVTANGVTASNVAWSWRPSDLFSLGFGADWQMNLGAGLVSGSATAYGEQDIRLMDVTGPIPLTTVLSKTPYAVYISDGVLSLDIPLLEITNGLPTTADGFVYADTLELGLLSPPVLLGNFELTLTPSKQEDAVIDLQIRTAKDVDQNPINITLDVIYKATGCYVPNGYVELTETADQRLQNLMTQMGNLPQGQTKLPLNLPGCLPSFQLPTP